MGVLKMPRDMQELVVEVSKFIQAESGNSLGPKQQSMVWNRLQRRMDFLNLPDPKDYFQYLSDNFENEKLTLVGLLTTHHTFFFREPVHYTLFSKNLDRLLLSAQKNSNKKINILSAACSRGQEAYSIGMVLSELRRTRQHFNYEILGTDIDRESLKIASNGVYKLSETRNIKEDYLARYFKRGKGDLSGYVKVADELHQQCQFKYLNLLRTTSALSDRKFDVIFCRNVLIYFDEEKIKKVINQLTQHLNPDGFLVTGLSEPLMGMGFNLKNLGSNIYQRPRRKKVRPRKQEEKSGSLKTSSINLNKRKRKSVLIIEDSVPVQKLIKKIVEKSSELEVFGVAADATEVKKVLQKGAPDLITLDMHLPGKNGVQILKDELSNVNKPVLIVSSIDSEENELIVEALDSGADSFMQKPTLESLKSLDNEIVQQLLGLSKVDNSKLQKNIKKAKPFGHFNGLVALGSSTGGLQALEKVFMGLPAETPPILIVQHIPAGFSSHFAKRMNGKYPQIVKEAEDGEELKKNTVYIAPGEKQMKVERSRGTLCVRVTNDKPVNRFKPSVDYLFASLQEIDCHLVAGLLTGMGKDGAQGMTDLKSLGHRTLAQDEETSVVFGMPREAIKLGGATQVVSICQMAAAIVEQYNKTTSD